MPSPIFSSNWYANASRTRFGFSVPNLESWVHAYLIKRFLLLLSDGVSEGGKHTYMGILDPAFIEGWSIAKISVILLYREARYTLPMEFRNNNSNMRIFKIALACIDLFSYMLVDV